MADRFTEECQRARAAYLRALDSLARARAMMIFDSDPAVSARREARAQARVDEARARMDAACGPQVVTTSLPGGVELHQEPGVPDDEPGKVRELIRELIPEDDLRELDEITLSDEPPPEREMEGRDEEGRRVRKRVRADGEYRRREKVIVDWYPPREEVIKHEIGHHVYHHRLTPDERRRWVRFWNDNRDRMPNDYSRENEGEGFAEAYEHLRDGKELDEGVLELITALAGPNPERPDGSDDEPEED